MSQKVSSKLGKNLLYDSTKDSIIQQEEVKPRIYPNHGEYLQNDSSYFHFQSQSQIIELSFPLISLSSSSQGFKMRNPQKPSPSISETVINKYLTEKWLQPPIFNKLNPQNSNENIILVYPSSDIFEEEENQSNNKNEQKLKYKNCWKHFYQNFLKFLKNKKKYIKQAIKNEEIDLEVSKNLIYSLEKFIKDLEKKRIPTNIQTFLKNYQYEPKQKNVNFQYLIHYGEKKVIKNSALLEKEKKNVTIKQIIKYYLQNDYQNALNSPKIQKNKKLYSDFFNFLKNLI